MKLRTLFAAVSMAGVSVMLAPAQSKLGMPDSTFVKSAAQGGMAEVKMGQLAKDKGSNQAVKDFGDQMVTDHSKANDELKSTVSSKGVTLPDGVSAKDQALYNRLNGMSGAAFDKAYINAMVKDHMTDISEFKKEASGGKDADVKNFASKTLPTLQHHLQMAKDAQAKLGSANSTN